MSTTEIVVVCPTHPESELLRAAWIADSRTLLVDRRVRRRGGLKLFKHCDVPGCTQDIRAATGGVLGVLVELANKGVTGTLPINADEMRRALSHVPRSASPRDGGPSNR
jgi:hypothetical protein